MLFDALSLVHLAAAGFVALLAIWLLIEVLASLPRTRPATSGERDGRIAVLIPAHNEGEGLAPTVRDVKAQLRTGDRVLVVADNCDDETAEVARREGAEVVERHDRERRGKGYALAFGIDHLRKDPPDAIVFTDADCLHSEGLIPAIASRALASGQPVQALYLMKAPPEASPARAVAAFAWLFMNEVRAIGLHRLTGTARLTGAGAAFPWPVAASMAFATGDIVEDLALSVSLAEAGTKVALDPNHLVTSWFPVAQKAAETQRARWEHGTLGIISRRVPKLLLASLFKLRPWAFLFALHLLVPPLSLFAVAVIALFAAGLTLLALGQVAGPALAGLALLAFGLAVGLGWLTRGREALPLHLAGGVLAFLTSKVGVYGRAASDSTRSWTRTPRDGESR